MTQNFIYIEIIIYFDDFIFVVQSHP